jgi:CDP-4-dehydro-6-deoxyglucose reductase
MVPLASPSRAVETFDMQLQVVENLSVTVVRLTLSGASGESMAFSEGQYLAIELPDGGFRSYSMANACRHDGLIDLHIRLHAHGVFSRMITDRELRPGSLLRVQGPFGDCVWQSNRGSISSTVLLATGTGIAPLNALIERALSRGHAQPIYLYWGGASVDDLYLLDHFRRLAIQEPMFHFVPVLLQPPADWQGESGYVQEAAARNHRDLSTAEVYACGAPAMVHASRALLSEECGLAEEDFHSDAFESSLPAIRQIATIAPIGKTISLFVQSIDGSRTSLALPEGASVLSALQEAGLARGICGGNKSCGACRVKVDTEWFDFVAPADRVERRLLSVLNDSDPFDRLACQIVASPAIDGLSILIHP